MRIYGKPFKELTLEKAIRIGAALGRSAGFKSLVISGRDAFRVSRMLKRAITAGIMSAGADVMDFHESLTGEISFAVKRFGAKLGFMVSLISGDDNVVIRLYKAPGHEILGNELKEIIDLANKDFEEPPEVGWIYYAEYMHRLYVAALSAFVKGDVVSSKKPTTVVSPSVEPLDTVLSDLSSTLGLNQVTIGGQAKELTTLSTNQADKLARVVGALNADFGALMTPDGSALSIYTTNLGILQPEELMLAITEKASPGSRIIALSPVSKTAVNIAVMKGYDVVVVNDETEFYRLVRRERPAIAFTWRGEFITPVFSLGYDSVLLYVQLLELVSEYNNVFSKNVKIIRDKLSIDSIYIDEAVNICREKGLDLSLWGCRIVDKDMIYTYVYNPITGKFARIRDQLAEVNY